MDWGMKNRLAKIIKPETGRAVMLAVDHGYFLGPLSRLEEPGKTIEPLLPYTDSLMLTRGVLRACVDSNTEKPMVLRVSGGNSVIGQNIANEGITTSMEEAIRLNVSAVAISVYIGTEYENQTLMNLSEYVNEGEMLGMPVLAVTAVGKELEKRDARYLSLCCRMCAELGAHFVKTYYCEEFEKIAISCPRPLVIAGGPKLETERDVFQMTHDALQKGAVGVDMGRNIWQHDYPLAMIKAIRHIVHENGTVDSALDLFNTEKG